MGCFFDEIWCRYCEMDIKRTRWDRQKTRKDVATNMELLHGIDIDRLYIYEGRKKIDRMQDMCGNMCRVEYETVSHIETMRKTWLWRSTTVVRAWARWSYWERRVQDSVGFYNLVWYQDLSSTTRYCYYW